METRIVNNSHTEIYANGGGWLTQSYPTNFHVFTHQKILAEGESADSWREVTDKEKTALEESDAKWVRPPQSFIDQWEAACYIKCNTKSFTIGKYNEETGYFELNGLTDISYSEALNIYRLSQFVNHHAIASPSGTNCEAPIYGGANSGLPSYFCRTYFPFLISSSGGRIYFTQTFYRNNKVEVVAFYNHYGNENNYSHFNDTFTYSSALREIKGNISAIQALSADTFKGCSALEEIRLDLKTSVSAITSVSFKDSPKLSFESLRFTVDGTVPRAITITVHADVYAAMQGQATYPFNGGTLKEWEQLLVDAAVKNLTFATA